MLFPLEICLCFVNYFLREFNFEKGRDAGLKRAEMLVCPMINKIYPKAATFSHPKNKTKVLLEDYAQLPKDTLTVEK